MDIATIIATLDFEAKRHETQAALAENTMLRQDHFTAVEHLREAARIIGGFNHSDKVRPEASCSCGRVE